MRVTPAPARIEIVAPDGTVLFDTQAGAGAGPFGALAVRRAEATYFMQFGAFNIDEEADPWVVVTRFSEVRVEGQTILFGLIGDDGGDQNKSLDPIAIRCISCAAPLTVTVQTPRNAVCGHCATTQYLPDPLWLSLHPVKKTEKWFVLFAEADPT